MKKIKITDKITIDLKLVFLLIFISTLCNSCKNEKSHLKDGSRSISEGKIITVDSNFSFAQNIFNIIENIEVDQLNNKEDSNFHFGAINQLVEFEERYYLKGEDHSIYSVNKNGDLVNFLRKEGSKPDEYRELTSFDIREKENQVYVYDFQKQRFLIYDLNFNFLKVDHIAFNFKSFKFYFDDLVLFTAKHLNKVGNEILNYDLIVLDKNYKIKTKAISFDSKNFPKIRFYKPNPFFKYQDKLLFNDYISDTIFSLKENTIKEELIFDYANSSWSDEFKKKPHSEIMETLTSQSDLFKDHDLLSNLSTINDNNLISNYSHMDTLD